MQSLPLAIIAALCALYFVPQNAFASDTEKDFMRVPEDLPWEDLPGSEANKLVYQSVKRRLGLPPLSSNRPRYQSDGLRFLIVKSFDTTLAVTLSRFTDLDRADNSEAFEKLSSDHGVDLLWLHDQFENLRVTKNDYRLTVNFTNHPEQYENIAGGSRFTTTIERYSAKVTAEQFDTIVSELFDGAFFSSPNFIPAKKLCADGAGYYLEAKIASHENFLGRHWCYPNYKEDIRFAKPLLELTKQQFPQLSDKLDALEAHVTAED